MDAAAAGAVWTPRPLNDLKISSIYNRSATEAPAEVSLSIQKALLTDRDLFVSGLQNVWLFIFTDFALSVLKILHFIYL